jgi:hypothetical protein
LYGPQSRTLNRPTADALIQIKGLRFSVMVILRDNLRLPPASAFLADPSGIAMGEQGDKAKDVLGRVYEYFPLHYVRNGTVE